eukprot:12127366-Alexandrium_andersonii.AAC.1
MLPCLRGIATCVGSGFGQRVNHGCMQSSSRMHASLSPQMWWLPVAQMRRMEIRVTAGGTDATHHEDI